jgi:hypothetical protein
MSDTTINTLKAALDSYRDAISAMTDDQWRDIIDDLDFNPDTDFWPEWEDKDEEIRQEMDFIENLDVDDKAVYITLSYVDDNEFNKVTGITATDGYGNILLDMDFIIPIDLDKSILEQIQEAV